MTDKYKRNRNYKRIKTGDDGITSFKLLLSLPCVSMSRNNEHMSYGKFSNGNSQWSKAFIKPATHPTSQFYFQQQRHGSNKRTVALVQSRSKKTIFNLFKIKYSSKN